ncbi:Competence protein F, phosphoribosyltransferase domain protein [Labilithrix luteola]|uniref:Competence protein F, phosphoribosyltransferase domain protein n=1 Tax=Labilithrix luteola TaxID=1391654 RepID=A0A0K1PRX7_9BACT|nr:ComF family protein [Labilithrix luteola]AKU95879.1 Competence protein F, phosphoribosyltransferase domain protein [Labilithrix luteola]
MQTPLLAFGRVALDAAGELVAPNRCAACDSRIRRRTLFCASCAVSVIERRTRYPSRECAVFAYGGAIATAIARCKYGGRPDLAPRLGEMMATFADSFDGQVDVVVSVPLHPRRLADRGFDQAALLARQIARRLVVPWAPRALARVHDTPKQASLDKAARATNLKGAFVVRTPEAIQGRRVLLVDDVRTTGATLSGCVTALRTTGAEHVWTMVLANRDREEDERTW